jgi:OMF family outer membrane factor
MRKIFIAVILMILGLPAWGRAITREEAVQFALEKSESIRIAEGSAETVRAKARQSVAFTRPQVSLESAYVEMGNNADSGSLSLSPDRDISAGLTGSQLVYAAGRIQNSWELEKNLYQQADLLLNSGKRDIAQGVKNAFDAVLLQESVVEILKDRLKQRQNELTDADNLREAGMATSLDVRQARLNLNFAVDALKSGQQTYQDALIQFNVVIGRSGKDTQLIPEGKLDDSLRWEMLLNKLNQAFSEDKLLDIQSRKKETEAADLRYQITDGELWPEVALVATGLSNGDKIDDTVESWTVGVRLNWNIFDGDLVNSKLAENLAQKRIAGESLSKTRKALAGEIEKIHSNFKTIEERLRIQKEAVVLSSQNYEDAREQYRAGLINLTRLGDFNLDYAEARFILQRLYFSRHELMNNSEALLEQTN